MKKFWEFISNQFDGITFFDMIIYLAVFFLLITLSPYLVRQFGNLQKIEDIVWNVSFDLFWLCIGIIVVMVLTRLLNKFNDWSQK